MVHGIAALIGVMIVVVVLDDVFESIVLPRRVTRRWRLVGILLRSVWAPWRALARRQRRADRREGFLSYFGPLSVILLLAIWASGLVIGFAIILWAAGSPVKSSAAAVRFGSDLYVSGTTFFTLGLGDIVPTTSLGRFLLVVEVAIGFGVLALVISYLPILYQAFAQREIPISLLDARAGSPPSAVEFLRRHADPDLREDLNEFLQTWEEWSAQVLESHLSYPVLAYFRSQHDNQSWLAALTMMLDVCALMIAGVEGVPASKAKFTFAMARHTVVDLCQTLWAPPIAPADRLPAQRFEELCTALAEKGLHLSNKPDVEANLKHIRDLYEPYVNALADRLLLELPVMLAEDEINDNWRSTAWEPRSGQPLF